MYSQPRPASDHGCTGASASATPSASSLAGWEQESAGDGSADSTFKAKMERLSDKMSTNLYIEGLPLSIDEATLAALVSPYSIRSSRFFQTKLSSPPRIIAFVRLETRAAAEEIIERLHGRMVRGWNDPGSRISVRFADTSEQRELRRQERLTREGDQASNQLSIAQATLLNLRGKELHARAPIAIAPPPSRINTGMHDDFHSDAGLGYTHFEPDYLANDFEVDYSRVPARYPPQAPLGHFAQQHQAIPAQRMNPAMASLLESLQTSGAAADFRGRDAYAPQEALSYRTLQQQQQQQEQLAALSARTYVPHGLGIAPPPQTAHGGYTATEEFILRARSNSLPQKRRPMPLDLNQAQQQQQRHQEMEAGGANIGVGVR
ncbi:rCop c3, partial [Mycena maculata]